MMKVVIRATSLGIRNIRPILGTIIEGDLERILTLAGRMHHSAFEAGVMRVVTTIKVDERRDKPLTMNGKVEAVRRRLEEQG